MKKTTIRLTYLAIAGMLITLNIGCNKIEDFGNTNVNPNGSASVEPGSLIANVEYRLGSRSFGSNDPAASTLEGFYCQYFAEPTYPGASRYAKQDIAATGYYAGALEDCQYVINVNSNPATAAAASISGPNASQIAIARILKAYLYWQITDLYGDMPYSEALKGTANLLPKYDAQELIYKDMIKELTEAADQFDVVGTNVKNDLIYGGSVAKWRKFANSLRMLMAVRLSKKYPAAGGYAATEFNNALTSTYGYITDNADNFGLLYPASTLQYNNPWSSTGNSADLGESQTMTDALAGYSDTRINSFGSNTTGVPYGLASAAPTTVTYAKILAAPFKAINGRMEFITASSVLLAVAEGIERGWAPGKTTADAKIAYEAGITQSFTQWNVTMPASYLTTGPANYLTGGGVASIGGASVAGSNALTPTKIARINVQQWFAFYPMGRQGWANWRRTGYPDIKPTVFANDPGAPIPRRIPYPQIDYSTNAAQVALAAAAIGGDTQNTPVWWDKP
jgi:hypothetical protein